MNIYTRTGDNGDTGLFGGARVRKDVARVEAYGTVDELNALLGLARAEGLPEAMDAILARVQNELFCVGAELATPEPQRHGMQFVRPEHLAAMERQIDQFEPSLPPLRQFVLPGGTRAAALLHVARTVCRRAERCVVTLADQEQNVSLCVVAYLNRLGDLLFVLARAANALSGEGDTLWKKPSPAS